MQHILTKVLCLSKGYSIPQATAVLNLIFFKVLSQFIVCRFYCCLLFSCRFAVLGPPPGDPIKAADSNRHYTAEPCQQLITH